MGTSTWSASSSSAALVRGWHALRAAPARAVEFLGGLPAYLTVARLTLVLLALYGGGAWAVRVPMTMVCVLGILSERVALSMVTWGGVTVLLMLTNLSQLYVIDNHKILLVYWCLALSLCLARPSHRPLRFLARTLIGACFALSVLWKAIAPDFLDGSFFHHTLLTDSRFERFLILATGASPRLFARNSIAESALMGGEADEVYLSSTLPVSGLALAITVWTLLIEIAIAVAFLAPPRLAALHRWRNVLLAAFIATIYPVATVIGFGWILCILGFAQCRHHERRAKAAYVALFLLLQVYLVPWARVAEVRFRLY